MLGTGRREAVSPAGMGQPAALLELVRAGAAPGVLPREAVLALLEVVLLQGMQGQRTAPGVPPLEPLQALLELVLLQGMQGTEACCCHPCRCSKGACERSKAALCSCCQRVLALQRVAGRVHGQDSHR